MLLNEADGALQADDSKRHVRPFKIAIFSKFEYAGGSEFRCVEMANGLARRTGVQVTVFAERKILDEVRRGLSPRVEVVEQLCEGNGLDKFYDTDTILVVNTDSKEFTRVEYWHGESARHRQRFDLGRIRAMTFLFNFIVSPSRHLVTLAEQVADLRIITANRKFYHEISEQDRYLPVRHYPRLCLESPIDPASVQFAKHRSSRLRFGAYARASGSKWNPQWPQLIQEIGRRCPDRVSWEFMGMPKDLAESVKNARQVKVRREFDIPVGKFLQGVDVFVYFPTWGREEAWSRSVAEALVSGCPVLATAKGGNQDQILHGNNGLLCKTFDDFVAGCERLADNAAARSAMSRNAAALARAFHTEQVVTRFLDFVTA